MPIRPRILVAEDDAEVMDLVRVYLAREGFEVAAAGDGETALELAQSRGPDLLVLDVMLPKLDGWAVCRRLREQEATRRLPIVMLTSRSDEMDRVLGLELGADDYVTKPFSPRELVARIKAVLRRSGEGKLSSTQRVLTYRGLRIDPVGREVEVAGRNVSLTAREFDLLWLLASNPGRAYRRAQLYEAVWGEEALGDLHTVDVHISRLRTKLEQGGGPRYIVTVWAIGYKFEVADDV
jgi:two-component system alkaline phosphatase synthesis response regulator PhoP